MKRTLQKGFTLIELMIVVAIIGILAAVALPAYSDYMKKSKISELVLALSAYKNPLQEYFTTMNAWPTTAQLGLDTATNYSSKYVSAITYTQPTATASGTTVTLAATASNIGSPVDGKVLALTGTVKDSGALDWQCGGTASTTIDNKYLTAACKKS